MSYEDRIPATVLGVQIGTTTGWDQIDLFDFLFYEFQPLEGVDLPSGDLRINYDTGKFYTHDIEGNVTFERRILDHMKGQ